MAGGLERAEALCLLEASPAANSRALQRATPVCVLSNCCVLLAACCCRSGGGGGTKGPAVVDKRNQELPCPHCDRIFKQADRLKQHVQKQHADIDGAAEAGDGSGSSGAAPAATAQPNVLAVAAVAAAASAAIKSVAAAGAKGGGSGGGGSAAGTAAAAAAGGGGSGSSTSGPKLMDVGSKAGFYEAKSPKLLLHEWCLREKAPRPRYRPSEAEGGLWKCKVGAGSLWQGTSSGGRGCSSRTRAWGPRFSPFPIQLLLPTLALASCCVQVVLPHPKLQEKDVVVFLDDSQAATSQEEAEQRAAVAALHRVQVGGACAALRHAHAVVSTCRVFGRPATPCVSSPTAFKASAIPKLSTIPISQSAHSQGDRALDRILPRPYVQQWKDLDQQVGGSALIHWIGLT